MTPDESRPRSDDWPAHRLLAALLLAVVVISGALIVFLPIGWQLNRFVVWLYYTVAGILGSSLISIEGYDFLLNMALFAVPAFLASIVWPRVHWWQWLLFWLVVSLGIETVQFLFLPRDATLIDLAANTLGAVCGVALGWPVRR